MGMDVGTAVFMVVMLGGLPTGFAYRLLEAIEAWPVARGGALTWFVFSAFAIVLVVSGMVRDNIVLGSLQLHIISLPIVFGVMFFTLVPILAAAYHKKTVLALVSFCSMLFGTAVFWPLLFVIWLASYFAAVPKSVWKGDQSPQSGSPRESRH
jgi:hypothetical protein